MENDKLSADIPTMIKYLLRKKEAPMETADIPAGINCLEVRALQFTLEGSAYDADNKDFYLKLFWSMNVIIAGPYVNNFSKTKDGNNTYFAIHQNFMSDNAMNRSKEKTYSALEASKHCGKSQRFTYENHVLIFLEEYEYFI